MSMQPEITDTSYKPPPGRLGNLTPEQEQTLEKFKEELKAEGHFVPERMDDATLLKFLRARKFDLVKAKAMILATEKWRKDFGVDEIVASFDFKEAAEVDKYYPQYYHKMDKDGRPIYVERLGLLNINELYKITTKERQLKRLVYEYEKFLSDRLPACSKAVGHPVETCCSILDLKDVSLFNFWKVKDYIQEAAGIYQNHYPECMGKMYVLNAPFGFTTAYNVVKRWLDPVTVSKITVMGSDYKETLLAQIPAENLPREFGGECHCAEGYNGASTIKLGVLGIDKSPRIIPNGVFRSRGDKTTYVGKQLYDCNNFASLHHRLPFEKGYLVDWDIQKAVWDSLIYGGELGVDPGDASLLITEPYFDLPKLQDIYDQFVFEEYGFKAYHRCTPASMMPYGDLFRLRGHPAPECMLIVDSGFSFTHVVPILSGSVVWDAVKRIDVGGKLLTNHLKELVSFRQWDMMDETYIINDVKEACCYASQEFEQDLEACKIDARANPIVQEYILPDFSVPRPGHVRQPGEQLQESYQILYMNNERFSVPEVIFRPDDIGMEQSGLAATIAHSISLLPEDLQGMFWAHIGLIGGNTKFPGFRERLTTELRSLAPDNYAVEIYQAPEPIRSAYQAAVSFASHSSFSQHVVTKAEYDEFGSNVCRRKFGGTWRGAESSDVDATASSGAAGKGKGRAVEEDTDSESEEEEVVTVSAKRGTRGRGRGAGTKKK
ncbi:Actin- protein 6 [Steccherinum ochraceum]|uniref:Actin-like protein ARP6 n=1 Tax=Steccherinum ochraceum TaxID=92696 RepID=A0A4R0RIC8_9APHY|nr:Actin- protein 6 [Steccherinum ochraceum]